tara:strand:+ start:1709 stop:2467 length:759 start_codon:yes stop_codon:yes gene_type:complete
MTTHLVIPDQHAHPDFHNERATWLGNLIADVKPDVIVNIGDGADMHSLSSYDKGKRSFHGRSYRKDIESHTDFQDRMWAPVYRRKKKLPLSYYFIGNHEQRIERALDLSPELVGTMGYDDLELEQWYDEVIPYDGQTPGTKIIDGISYGHYFVSGVMGRPIGGEHHAYSLIAKRLMSSTCGHSHLLDYSMRTDGANNKIMGLVCGSYIDYRAGWAGNVNDLWWSGVVIKRNIQNGCYDPEFVSLQTLKDLYK